MLTTRGTKTISIAPPPFHCASCHYGSHTEQLVVGQYIPFGVSDNACLAFPLSSWVLGSSRWVWVCGLSLRARYRDWTWKMPRHLLLTLPQPSFHLRWLCVLTYGGLSLGDLGILRVSHVEWDEENDWTRNSQVCWKKIWPSTMRSSDCGRSHTSFARIELELYQYSHILDHPNTQIYILKRGQT